MGVGLTNENGPRCSQLMGFHKNLLMGKEKNLYSSSSINQCKSFADWSAANEIHLEKLLFSDDVFSKDS